MEDIFSLLSRLIRALPVELFFFSIGAGLIYILTFGKYPKKFELVEFKYTMFGFLVVLTIVNIPFWI